MAQSPIPFSHENTSELAKALRRNLSERGHGDIKQTEMLHALANSAGARNFQSYRARSKSTVGGTTLVALRSVMPSIRELFGRDSMGQIEDRRHQRVNRLIYGLNATIDPGECAVDVVLRIEAAGDFDGDYEPDEDLISAKGLEALASRLEDPNVDLHERIELIVDLDTRVEGALIGNGQAARIARIPTARAPQLLASAAEARASTRECEACVDFLKSLAEAPERAARDRDQTRRALAYMRDIVNCSGEPFMYSWNDEKISGIRHIVGRWINGNGFEEGDRRYVFQNLFVFNAPKAWVRRPRLRWDLERQVP